MKKCSVALVSLMIGWAPAAFAGTVDFEDQDYGLVAGNTLVVEVGGITVTFTGEGLQIRTLGGNFDSTYCQTKYLSTSGDSQQITVTFSEGVDDVTILNPINGTATAEVDEIAGNAYDSGDALLDSFSSTGDIDPLVGPGITRVTYDDVGGTGYVIGALSFNGPLVPCQPAAPAAPVPTTGSLGLWILIGLLLLIGLLGMQVRRRRTTAAN